tara:strand:+ start:1152 stop:1829 length:678 start_codon:yes stop_codon:yes gene_type:complete
MIQNCYIKTLPKNWVSALKKQSLSQSFETPLSKVLDELKNDKKIAPDINDIFKAFELCSFRSTKVVIFGQDPYFQKGYANGLAFSVSASHTIPASLMNIFKEIKSDIGSLENKNGCLKNWASQGVLLLNSSLTVELLKPGSHANIGWHDFICDIVKILSKKKNIVFMLWGNHAKNFKNFIDEDKNLILTSAHPSPLSAYRGFFGNRHFSKCNEYLIRKNIAAINW